MVPRSLDQNSQKTVPFSHVAVLGGEPMHFEQLQFIDIIWYEE